MICSSENRDRFIRPVPLDGPDPKSPWRKISVAVHNNIRPHSALNGRTPASARRVLELQMSSAHGALAKLKTMKYLTAGLSE